MKTGWVRIHRQIEENPLWLSEPFTRAQAWIDLIVFANHKPGFFYVRGNKVSLDRGQIGWSQVSMASRWRWNRKKVVGFLKQLEMGQQITQQNNTVTSIITIKNYDRFQSEGTAEGTAEGQQRVHKQEEQKNKNNSLFTVLPEKKYSKLTDLTELDFQELASDYGVPVSFVKSQFEVMSNWLMAKGKSYKNYKAGLRNFVKSEALKIRKEDRVANQPKYIDLNAELERRSHSDSV